MSTDATSSYASDLFKHDLYKIKASNDPLPNGAYPVGTTYKIKFKTDTALEIPLALLYATFQIALSDVASYQAESYMNKIVTNQEIQVASNSAIAEAEKMKGDLSCATMDEFLVNYPNWILVDGNDEAVTAYLETLIYDKDAYEGFIYINFDDVIARTLEYLKKEGAYIIDKNRGKEFAVDFNKDLYAMTLDVVYATEVGDEKTLSATEINIVEWSEVYQKVTNSDPDYSYSYNAVSSSKNVLDTGGVVTPTEEFILNCYTAGITEVNGKQLCTVDEAGEVTPSDVTLTEADLDELIDELDIARGKASSSSQEDMVFAEEYLGQYTSYLSGSSTNIDELGTALLGVAQRI